MELQTIASTPSTAAAPLCEPEARSVMNCRCEGCGSPVAFNALIVSCGCADGDRAADSTLH